MKWQNKAKIMKICSNMPGGNEVYKVIQKSFGRLNATALKRIPSQLEMANWIKDQGMTIEGRTFFEVGTGHKPVVPVGFFLCGAESCITVDLNRRIDFPMMIKTLAWISQNRTKIESFYKGITDPVIFNERFSLLSELQTRPEKFFAEANIKYIAPADVRNTGLLDGSVDYHLSNTVLEHIPGKDIENIFVEAKRILKPDGAAIHFIDLSDHFQHQDSSITQINFLRFDEKEWMRIAGNEFAYCNRLRANDFISLFSDLSFKTIKSKTEVDEKSMMSIRNGFKVDKQFKPYSLENICTTSLNIMLKK